MSARTTSRKGPAGQFERLLKHSSEAEINTWAVRTFGQGPAIVILWLVGEVKRLRAEVAELQARKGR